MSHPLVVSGLVVGVDELTNFEFDANRPHTYCRLCGAVYQTDRDRTADTLLKVQEATEGRKRWSHAHARTHADYEHQKLANSGHWLTEEAAYRLAAYGIVSLFDLVTSESHEKAYAQASNIASDNPEGTN